MAYLDIDCEHVTSIEPRKMATNKSYLTVCVKLTRDHADQLLGDVIGELFATPQDFAEWFKAEYPEAVENWINEAAEAYQERRDERATS